MGAAGSGLVLRLFGRPLPDKYLSEARFPIAVLASADEIAPGLQPAGSLVLDADGQWELGTNVLREGFGVRWNTQSGRHQQTEVCRL